MNTLKYIHLSDCHNHSNISFDGHCTPREMVERAVEIGLYCHAITDHCECHIYYDENHQEVVTKGLAEMTKLKEEFKGKIKFLVNDLLMNIPQISSFWVPINKTGKQARNFPQQVNAAFQSDNHIVMFPAGLCSRKKKGVIKDLPWKKTFITKSVQSQRDIIPIHFEGENSKFFYRLANINQMLGIKFNIAMLYLSDEMFKNKNKKFKVTIGKPIPWQTFDKTRNATEWAQYVQDAVYAL